MLKHHGIEKFITSLLNQLDNKGGIYASLFLFVYIMEYKALGHACSALDLFANMKIEKFKMDKNGRNIKKRKKAASIFIASMRLIVQDIIDNNIQFKLPSVGTGSSYIQMYKITGERFKKAFRAGAFRNVDFIASNFTAYYIIFQMCSTKRTPRMKNLYVNNAYTNQITENTNKGKTY